jgi:hypothetical protein
MCPNGYCRFLFRARLRVRLGLPIPCEVEAGVLSNDGMMSVSRPGCKAPSCPHVYVGAIGHSAGILIEAGGEWAEGAKRG